jgi:hypothetical protein
MKSYLFAALALLSLPAYTSDWATQAQHDMGTPGGKQYEMVAAKYAASALGQVMGACVESSLPSTFQLYIKLSASGAVVASSVSPVSSAANCFAGQLSKLTGQSRHSRRLCTPWRCLAMRQTFSPNYSVKRTQTRCAGCAAYLKR